MRAFLDTNVILRGFASYINGGRLPSCFVDPRAHRLTFEKCIFECYGAFRGVGGKKPSEGRGQWAEVHLRGEGYPLRIGDLASKYCASIEDAFYQSNQILESASGIDDFFEATGNQEMTEVLRGLARDRVAFERLAAKLHRFLEECEVQIVPYLTVFGGAPDDGFYHACRLNEFALDHILPSEDFEIVFAALMMEADLFITDDAHLRKCAYSLGLNAGLHQGMFTDMDGYDALVSDLILAGELEPLGGR